MYYAKKATSVLGSLTILKIYICCNKIAGDTAQEEKANPTTTTKFQNLKLGSRWFQIGSDLKHIAKENSFVCN